MRIQRIAFLIALALGVNASCASVRPTTQAQPVAQQTKAPVAAEAPKKQPEFKPLRPPDVVYVPTPHETVDAMLKVAKVGPNDVVYDLGSGDGRIPIMAVQKYNAKRAVGIDINPERIQEAEGNRKAASMGDRVRFINADLFETDISSATVVTLYLLPSLNIKLIPKLLAELKPGTRIVSHAFDMGSWKPEQTLRVNGTTVYFWTIPAKGTREYAAAAEAANKK